MARAASAKVISTSGGRCSRPFRPPSDRSRWTCIRRASTQRSIAPGARNGDADQYLAQIHGRAHGTALPRGGDPAEGHAARRRRRPRSRNSRSARARGPTRATATATSCRKAATTTWSSASGPAPSGCCCGAIRYLPPDSPATPGSAAPAGWRLCEPLSFRGRKGTGRPGNRNAYARPSACTSLRLAEGRIHLPPVRPALVPARRRQLPCWQRARHAPSSAPRQSRSTRALAQRQPHPAADDDGARHGGGEQLLLARNLHQHADRAGRRRAALLRHRRAATLRHGRAVRPADLPDDRDPTPVRCWPGNRTIACSPVGGGRTGSTALPRTRSRHWPERRCPQRANARRLPAAAADVAIQAALGRFFAHKLRAGVLWEIFAASDDAAAAAAALSSYQDARAAWMRGDRRPGRSMSQTSPSARNPGSAAIGATGCRPSTPTSRKWPGLTADTNGGGIGASRAAPPLRSATALATSASGARHRGSRTHRLRRSAAGRACVLSLDARRRCRRRGCTSAT